MAFKKKQTDIIDVDTAVKVVIPLNVQWVKEGIRSVMFGCLFVF